MNINEGIYDKGIFKAIFLAGGPGSGKSFFKKKFLGNFKSLDADQLGEFKLKKENIPLDINKRNTPEEKKMASKLSRKAWKTTFNKKLPLFLEGRLPIVIDRTGVNYEPIAIQKRTLEDLGYETKMIFVDTPLDIALKRNETRDRTLSNKLVKDYHVKVRTNLDNYKLLFGNNNFIAINNSKEGEDPEWNKEWVRINKWFNTPVNNKKVQEWKKIELSKKAKIVDKKIDDLSKGLK
ncbi:MAG TPA: AAA family ATPase [Candidatus Paceibacterota bacterium]|nr:AAA family ATPase [Candidatus Paceibacterota bacterium]